jgi:hypothetical protein
VETHLEQELAAEATPTRRRKSKGKAKKVGFKEPLVESSDVEASEEIGRGRARQGRGPLKERDYSSDSSDELRTERRSRKSTAKPTSEPEISAAADLGKEPSMLRKRPEWFSEFDFKHYNTLEGFEQIAFSHEKELQWQRMKCLELEAQKSRYQPRYTAYGEPTLLPPPKRYDGGNDIQKLKDWVVEMEIFMEAKGIPREQWPLMAASYLTSFPLHEYIRWRDANQKANHTPTWEEMVAKLKKRVPDDPDWEARMKMVACEYRGDISKHIDHFSRIVDPIMNATDIELIFYFIRSLPENLRTKMALKRKKFDTIHAAYEKAVNYVVNRPKLGKRDSKEKVIKHDHPAEQSTHGVKKGVQHGKRRWEKTQSEGRKGEGGESFAAKRQKTSATPSPSQWKPTVAKEDKVTCFNCNKEGHWKKDCPDLKSKRQVNSIRSKYKVPKGDEVSPLLTPSNVEAREPSGNEPLVIDLPAENQVDVPELFFVKCWIGTNCVSAMVDTGATANFISEGLAKQLGLESTVVREPITCQFSNGAFDFCTSKLARREVRFVGKERDVLCREDFFVLKKLGLGVILSIDFVRRYGVSIHPKEGFLRIPVPGQGTFLHILADYLGSPNRAVQFHSMTSMAKLATPKQLDKSLRAGHQCWAIRFDEIEKSIEKKGVQVGLQASPKIRSLLEEYKDVLSKKLPEGIPPNRAVDHAIDLVPGSLPIAKAPYRMSQSERKLLMDTIIELKAQGFIRESKSPYGSPVIFVTKPDGTWRLCVDYRALNKQTIKNKYALPRMDDLFDSIAGSKFYSKIDLRQGYYQIRIKEGDEYKTAMRTRYGSYEFLVMPFGLCNAPATFMTLMNSIFGKMIDEGVVVYLDDILVYSKTMEEHEQTLERVLSKLRSEGLYAKPTKCLFVMEEVEFLGHTLTQDGIKPSKDKCEAIKNWETPKSVTGVRSFIGFVAFYRRYIKSFGKIVCPLYDLTKKSCTFYWNKECEEAFQELKTIMINPPVLKLPEPGKAYEIWTDASEFAIGGVLHQDERPCAFESVKLTNKWPIHDREMYAIVHCCKQWETLLVDSPKFTIFTDNVSCKYFDTKDKLTSMQMRWQDYLSRFDFQIVYKPGRLNVVADALSRTEQYYQICHWVCRAFKVESEWPKIIKEAYKDDAQAQKWIKQLTLASASRSNVQKPACITWVDGLLKYKQNRIYIPKSLRTRLLVLFHESQWVGHGGQKSTLRLLKRNKAYWANMRQDCVDFVATCHVCQKNRTSYQKTAGLLEPLPIPTEPWESIAMDFIGELPKSKSYDSILVVVDRFSKMACFIPLKTTATAKDVADLVFAHVFRHWGMPKTMLSDRDPKFIAKFWKQLFHKMGAELLRSSAYYSQTDGQTERTNLELENYLRNYTDANQSNWSDLLYMAEFRYNSQVHSAIKFSPFFLATGRNPRLPIWFENPKEADLQSSVPAVEDFLKARLLAYEEATTSIACAQRSYKGQSDKHRRDVVFEVGNLVKVHLEKHQCPKGLSHKLALKWMGPFRIVQKIGKKAYKLDLPESMRITHVFNVKRLELWRQDERFEGREQVLRPPPEVTADGEQVFEVEAIINHQTRTTRAGRRTKYLIKWKGYDHCENTWLPEYELSTAPLVLEAYKQLKGLD